jgi:hypothetical protein
MTTNAPDAHEAQAPLRTFRNWRWRIPLRPLAVDISERRRRAAEEKRKALDEARRQRAQFNVRVARAVALIATLGCSARRACRSVGLKAKNERAVQTACDSQLIPRWRASPQCRAVLLLSLPLPPQPKPRPRRMRAMTTYVPLPAFVDSPAQRKAACAKRRKLRQCARSKNPAAKMVRR